MKGDFSRIRFNPAKQYTAVLQQQGRVALDSDANEQGALGMYLRETINADVIGRCGGPIDDAGFAISIQGNEIQIGAGRYYVDGILAENSTTLDYDNQPFLVAPTFSAAELIVAVLHGKGQVTAQLRLEIWQRLVTQLDDPCLQEPALCQADTTVRLQTVWRVVGAPVTASSTVGTLTAIDPGQGEETAIALLSPCCQSMYGDTFQRNPGALGADTGNTGSDCGCQPIPSAGYQGLENQLYRVEIHTPGGIDTATYKWSRENASVVTQITDVNGAVLAVPSIGPDANLGFQVGHWVELTDDTYLFGQPPNQPGALYQITSIQPSAGQYLVTLSAQVVAIDHSRNARMRRWDQNGATVTGQGIPLSAIPVQLENGIEVSFRKGDYVAGDYWTIPARTANGQIDWPPCGGNGNFFQAPQFIRVHTAPLACIHLRNRQDIASLQKFRVGHFERLVVEDCRLLFPPLAALAASTASPALHVKSMSWMNDDLMTVDTLIANGLSVTLDQTPTCPWSGANFRVTLEAPVANDPIAQFSDVVKIMVAAGKFPAGTDVFLRSELVLDPPEGITVAGSQINWLLPAVKTGIQMYNAYWLFVTLNTLLVASKATGYGRVRVRLEGGAVYANQPTGNLYLDGQSFGTTSSRGGDGSQSIQLRLPTGNAARASDFESWFYLAPTVLIGNVAIQAVASGDTVPINAVTVVVNFNGTMIGLQTGAATAPVVVTSLQAVITLTYPPIADTPVSLTLNGTGVGPVVTIQATATVPAGQSSVTVPITILASPGPQATDTVTLGASVATAVGNFPFNQNPSLAITGGFVPSPPIN